MAAKTRKPAGPPRLAPLDEALRLYYSGRPREAGEILVRIVRDKPGEARAWGLLGACHGQLGNFAASLQSVDRALALQPDDPLLLTIRVRALRMLGHTEEGLDAFRLALTRDPGHVTAATGLALLLSSLNRWDEAWDVIAPFLDRDPVSHQAALAAAWQERFSPAARDGVPIEYTLSFTYRFRASE